MPIQLTFSTDLPVVLVTIRRAGKQDATDVPALLDTGAGLSLISDDLVQSHARTPNQPITTTPIYPAGSVYPVLLPMYDFDEIEIGARSYADFTALSIDFSFVDHGSWTRMAPPYRVIIGKDLQELIGPITVDQSLKTITLP